MKIWSHVIFISLSTNLNAMDIVILLFMYLFIFIYLYIHSNCHCRFPLVLFHLLPRELTTIQNINKEAISSEYHSTENQICLWYNVAKIISSVIYQKVHIRSFLF